MNQRKWNQEYKLIELCLVILTVLFIGIVVYFNNQQGQQNIEIKKLQDSNASLKSNISQKKENIAERVTQDSLTSANPKIRLSSRQIEASEQAEIAANSAFPILLNYSSVKQYLARKKASEDYLSSSVLTNPAIFDEDKDDLNYLKWSKLHSEFNSLDFSCGNLQGNKLPVIINAHYTSWDENARRNVMQDLYLGTFDYKTQKFTELKRFGNIYSGDESGN